MTILEACSERMAPDPVEIQDPKTETCIIFWSSGTTGRVFKVVADHDSLLTQSMSKLIENIF